MTTERCGSHDLAMIHGLGGAHRSVSVSAAPLHGLLALRAAQAASANSPAYRLIYSPVRGGPVGDPNFMIEAAPGLFYFDSS
jgi:hypothetical protein